MSSFFSRPSGSSSGPSVLLFGASAAVVALVGYATYFDYRRRTDPAFRLRLLKERKAVEQRASSGAVGGTGTKKDEQQALKRAIESIKKEPLPTSLQESEAFFLQQVSLGEQLAKRGPDFYVAAAISLFRALKVYPAPQELMMILQQTQPAPVFDFVLELLRLDTASSASTSSDAGVTEPLLEEVSPSSPEKETSGKLNGSENGSSTTEASEGSSEPSGTSSFVHVPSEPAPEPELPVAVPAPADREPVDPKEHEEVITEPVAVPDPAAPVPTEEQGEEAVIETAQVEPLAEEKDPEEKAI